MDDAKRYLFNFLYLRRFVLVFIGTCSFLLWVIIDHNSILFGGYNSLSQENFLNADQMDLPNLLMNSPTINFEGFNNETGADHLIVPNVIHYIRFNKPEFSFGEFICLQSAYRYQRPDKIFLHTNNVTEGFRGKYWSIIEKDPKLRACIQILPLEIPTEIFGQKLNPQWVVPHGSDVARFRLMMKYGGIYLDTDSFVIRNLDKYRKFECAVEWKKDGNEWISTAAIIAHKDARFLPLWLGNYRDYHPNEW